MKKLLIILIIAPALFISCSKNLSSLNIDPKSASTGIPSALFLQGELNLVNSYTSTSVASAPFRVLSQEWTENAYTYEANYVLSYYNSPNGFWNNLYVNTIHNLNLAKQSFPKNFLGTPGTLRNDLIITDILQVYAYDLLIATYGDIPYSQSESDSIPFAKYDDAKTVCLNLLMRLDTCIAGLNTSEGSMGSADQIYGGDPAKWLKFASTLKLKIGMLLADVDPATAKKNVTDAINKGVFESNDDNALFTYDPSSPSNSNPIWQAISFSGRHDFGPSNLLVNTMVGWNDPRVPFYFQDYPKGSGKYIGGVPGAPNSYGKYSDLGAQLYDPTLPGDILDYPEVEFYLAEAAERGFISGGSAIAATHYNNAVTASIEFWGGSASNAAVYLAQPAVSYATAAVPWQQKIGYQEWIAFYNRNWDSWTCIRRLGYPDIDVVNPPTVPASTFPLRFYYPPNEQTSNPTNWAAAVAKIPSGKDVVTAKLFFEK